MSYKLLVLKKSPLGLPERILAFLTQLSLTRVNDSVLIKENPSLNGVVSRVIPHVLTCEVDENTVNQLWASENFPLKLKAYNCRKFLLGSWDLKKFKKRWIKPKD